MSKLTDSQMDQMFRDGIGDISLDPSANVWKGLDTTVTQNLMVKFKLFSTIWKWLAIGLGTSLVAVVGYYEWSGNQTVNKEFIANTTVNAEYIIQEAEIVQPPEGKTNQAIISPPDEEPQTKAVISQTPESKPEPIVAQQTVVRKPVASKPTITNDVVAETKVTEQEALPPQTVNSSVTGKSQEDERTLIRQTERPTEEKVSTDKPVIKYEVPKEPVVTDAQVNTRTQEVNDDPEPLPDVKGVEEEQKVKFASRFSVAGFFVPVYNNRIIKTKESKEYFNVREKGALSNSIGLRIGFDINDKWSIEGGAGRSVYSQNVWFSREDLEPEDGFKKTVLMQTSSALTQWPGEEFEKEIKYEARETIRYLRFPLLIKYKLPGEKTQWHFSGGVSLNALLKPGTALRKGKMGHRGTHDEGMTGLSPLHYDAHLAFGFERRLSKHFNLLVEPRFSASLSSINQKMWIKSYPWSVGLATGIRYRF